MKFSNLLNESSVSNAYTTIINKVKGDISSVSKSLAINDDDMYENPKTAKEFWNSFFSDMENLRNVIAGYQKVLIEIDDDDDIYNKCDLGSLLTKFRELHILIGKKLDIADNIKVLK